MTAQESHAQRNFPFTKASFCICGEDFPHEALTEQLGISPTAAWRKGEVRRDRDGNRYYELHPDVSPGQYPYSLWRYSTEYEAVSDVMQSVSVILEKFAPLCDVLIRAKSQFSLSYQICIAMKRGDENGTVIFPEMKMSGAVIKFVDAIGAVIYFDFEGIIPEGA